MRYVFGMIAGLLLMAAAIVIVGPKPTTPVPTHVTIACLAIFITGLAQFIACGLWSFDRLVVSPSAGTMATPEAPQAND